MKWINVDDRLPEIGRLVHVWGAYCPDGSTAPIAYRRAEPNGGRGWFWSSSEWRGMTGISWWLDGPAPATPTKGYRPPCGPGDAGYR